jgi:hypothetical protein
MAIQQSWSGSGMTIGRVAPSKAGAVRLATPYLEVESRSTSSLERGDRAGAGADQPRHEEEAQRRPST